MVGSDAGFVVIERGVFVALVGVAMVVGNVLLLVVMGVVECLGSVVGQIGWWWPGWFARWVSG